MLPPLDIVDLGALDVESARERQLQLVTARQAGSVIDTVLFAEHPAVITVGRRQRALDNVLDAGGLPVVELERGGDVTLHAPGQLVAYPIVQLDAERGERDLHKYLRALEAAVIEVCVSAGVVTAVRRAGATGVWCGEDVATDGQPPRKLCSIGIACRKWVCFHGLALNVDTDLALFARMRPCGFDASVMTSLARELGRPIGVADVKAPLGRALARVLGRFIARAAG